MTSENLRVLNIQRDDLISQLKAEEKRINDEIANIREQIAAAKRTNARVRESYGWRRYMNSEARQNWVNQHNAKLESFNKQIQELENDTNQKEILFLSIDRINSLIQKEQLKIKENNISPKAVIQNPMQQKQNGINPLILLGGALLFL